MTDTELESILRHLRWSPERLALFLSVRGLNTPVGISKNDLVQLVLTSKDVPIVSVKASKPIFFALSHEQLLDYLRFRGYIIMTKGKIKIGVPEAYVAFQEEQLLKGAIEDFEKNYRDHSEDIDFSLLRVLKQKYLIPRVDTDEVEDYDSTAYQLKNVELLLQKFGVASLPYSSVEEKFSIAKNSINFFGTGEVY
ncbi:unnamed protein product [Kuraishia capsulata CBS 1993]|uniref:Uncharacterized protein n=1 Tax=Kuraishia capsulata CBS 1993 TaxID=1382522 RepID=W6MG66_9ASCO|nr:uncharacterized protein KUCA_T00000416001 [Kuraishia capsulata CBS 1993]CDK24453.1 unnamed protein product [Kuraishia capsulata CBS 1993]